MIESKNKNKGIINKLVTLEITFAVLTKNYLMFLIAVDNVKNQIQLSKMCLIKIVMKNQIQPTKMCSIKLLYE